jgi:hypothetical protein
MVRRRIQLSSYTLPHPLVNVFHISKTPVKKASSMHVTTIRKWIEYSVSSFSDPLLYKLLQLNFINMASTDGDDFITYYARIENYLYGILGSSLLCTGSVGNVLSCVVFRQKSMRQNPGSIYFITFNIANLLTLSVYLLPMMLANFHTASSPYSVVYCKIQYYVKIVSIVLPLYYLVLTSIDRTLVTSSNASTWQRSSHRLA